MLDFLILIALAVYIGKLAKKKGLKSGTWQLYTVLAWLGGEIIGISIGLSLFGIEQFMKIVLVALPCAFAGFHIVFVTLQKKPNVMNNGANSLDNNTIES
jgi:hypothetical protein